MRGAKYISYAEHQSESDEPEKDGTYHEVDQVFIRMLAVFLLRVNPASTRANPGCMKNTSIAASSIHTVLIPVDNSEILSTVPASSGEVCAAAINGKEVRKGV